MDPDTATRISEIERGVAWSVIHLAGERARKKP